MPLKIQASEASRVSPSAESIQDCLSWLQNRLMCSSGRFTIADREHFLHHIALPCGEITQANNILSPCYLPIAYA